MAGPASSVILRPVVKAISDFGAMGEAMSGSAVATALAADLRAWQQHQLRDAAIHFWLYKANPWVRTCVDLIAQRATADDYGIQSKSEDEQGIEALRVFLAQINPRESLDRLLRGVYRDRQINGNWYGRVQYQNGVPVAVYRIDFRTIVPVPAADGPIRQYQLFRNGNGALRGETIPAEEIIHLTLNDAGENGCGLSPLESLDFTLANDQAAIAYNTGFFQNGAKAGDIYEMDSGLDADRVEREREYLKENFTKPTQSFEPLFLQGGTKLLRDGSTIRKDMEFVKLREWNREETCAVYSTPLSLVTGQVGALGATGKEQDNILFKEAVIAPEQKAVFEDLNRQLLVERMGNTDLALIPPKIAGIRLDLVDIAGKMVKAGGTGNEARGVMRLGPVEGMDDPLFMAERGNMDIVGIPGHEDSVLLTDKGAMSARIQDPGEMGGKGAGPLVEDGEEDETAAQASGEPANKKAAVVKASKKGTKAPHEAEHGEGAPTWLKKHVAKAQQELDDWNAEFAKALAKEVRRARAG